jgi:DNA-binding PadR family transcriptional regulator
MGTEEGNITPLLARVLRAFLIGDPTAERYGLDLMKETDIPSGSLYPALARLERFGYLVSSREDIDPAVAGRPPRRNYRLNPEMAELARLEVGAFAQQFALPNPRRRAARRPGLAGA